MVRCTCYSVWKVDHLTCPSRHWLANMRWHWFLNVC
jgi:hypothetical protein